MIINKVLGFLNKFLAMPSSRESILYGKILFISVKGLLQATVILLIAMLLGVRISNPISIFLIYLTLFLFSVFFSALSTIIGLYLSDHDSYSAVNSMISMPLFFTSSALMPYEVMPAWLRTMAKFNPVSYTIDSTRMLFGGGIPIHGLVSLAIGAGIIVLSGHISFGRHLYEKRKEIEKIRKK